MAHHLLFYEVTEDYLERRKPLRTSHLAHARRAVEAGILQLGGAYGDPTEGALLLFKTNDLEQIRDFARQDPYVLHGVVTQWRIVPWTTVVGEDAAAPIPATP